MSRSQEPLVLFLSYSRHNTCFLQEIIPELGHIPMPIERRQNFSMKFPRPAVSGKDTQESHSFLKEYERGHKKERFLELPVGS